MFRSTKNDKEVSIGWSQHSLTPFIQTDEEKWKHIPKNTKCTKTLKMKYNISYIKVTMILLVMGFICFYFHKIDMDDLERVFDSILNVTQQN